MPTFDVEFLDKRGKSQSATVEGANEDEVISAFRESGLFPAKLEASRSRTATLDIRSLAAEAAEKDHRQRALNAKVQELQRRFEEGDDSAYDEMVALARLASEEPEYTEEVRETWRRQLDVLQAAGTAQGLREGKGVPAGRANRILVAHGALEDQVNSRDGALVLVPNQGLAFSEKRSLPDAEILVRFRDVVQIRERGLFKKRMEIVTRGGQVFRFTVDKGRTPAPLRSLFNPQRLWVITQIESGGSV